MKLAESVVSRNVRVLNETLSTRFPWDLKKLEEGYYDEDLNLKPLGVINKTYFVEINGHKYGYTSSGRDISDIAKTFEKMMQYGRGKALAWLKKNTDLASGSVKGVSPLMR